MKLLSNALYNKITVSSGRYRKGGGLQWFQLKPPLKICAPRIQPTSGRAGHTFHSNGLSDKFQKVAEC